MTRGRQECRLANRNGRLEDEKTDDVWAETAEEGLDKELESAQVLPIVDPKMAAKSTFPNWECEPCRSDTRVLNFVSDCTPEVCKLLAAGNRQNLRESFRRRHRVLKECDIKPLGKVPMNPRPCHAANRCICSPEGLLIARLKKKIDDELAAAIPKTNKGLFMLLLDGFITLSLSNDTFRRDFHVALQYQKPKIATFLEIEACADRPDMDLADHTTMRARRRVRDDGESVAEVFTIWDMVADLNLELELMLSLRQAVVSEKLMAVNEPNVILVRNAPLHESSVWMGAVTERELIKVNLARNKKRSRGAGEARGPQKKRKKVDRSPGGRASDSISQIIFHTRYI